MDQNSRHSTRERKVRIDSDIFNFYDKDDDLIQDNGVAAKGKKRGRPKRSSSQVDQVTENLGDQLNGTQNQPQQKKTVQLTEDEMITITAQLAHLGYFNSASPNPPITAADYEKIRIAFVDQYSARRDAALTMEKVKRLKNAERKKLFGKGAAPENRAAEINAALQPTPKQLRFNEQVAKETAAAEKRASVDLLVLSANNYLVSASARLLLDADLILQERYHMAESLFEYLHLCREELAEFTTFHSGASTSVNSLDNALMNLADKCPDTDWASEYHGSTLSTGLPPTTPIIPLVPGEAVNRHYKRKGRGDVNYIKDLKQARSHGVVALERQLKKLVTIMDLDAAATKGKMHAAVTAGVPAVVVEEEEEDDDNIDTLRASVNIKVQETARMVRRLAQLESTANESSTNGLCMLTGPGNSEIYVSTCNLDPVLLMLFRARYTTLDLDAVVCSGRPPQPIAPHRQRQRRANYQGVEDADEDTDGNGDDDGNDDGKDDARKRRRAAKDDDEDDDDDDERS